MRITYILIGGLLVVSLACHVLAGLIVFGLVSL